MQGLDLVEDVWKAWSNMVKGRALYQSVILRLLKLFRAKYVKYRELGGGRPLLIVGLEKVTSIRVGV